MTSKDTGGSVPLFDGKTLNGWFATPRTYDEMWPDGPTLHEPYPSAFPLDYNEQSVK